MILIVISSSFGCIIDGQSSYLYAGAEEANNI